MNTLSRIQVLGVLPRAPQKFVKPIQEINQRIKALGKKKYIHLLSMYEYFVDQSGLPKKALMRDTAHPNAKGYKVLAETMEPLMEKLLND